MITLEEWAEQTTPESFGQSWDMDEISQWRNTHRTVEGYDAPQLYRVIRSSYDATLYRAVVKAKRLGRVSEPQRHSVE